MPAIDDRGLSKRLSYVLRHDPASVGLELDDAGWVPVDDLLDGLAADGVHVDAERLERLVARGPKRRFELDDTGQHIRARYGHSVDVDPSHAPVTPPDVLYHGTHPAALERILAEGLRPMGRRQVHLSADVGTARQVGSRRGSPIVLVVDARSMHAAGQTFVQATQGVWLVDRVPAEFVTVLD